MELGRQSDRVSAQRRLDAPELRPAIQIEDLHAGRVGEIETARGGVDGEIVPAALASHHPAIGNVHARGIGGEGDGREEETRDRPSVTSEVQFRSFHAA